MRKSQPLIQKQDGTSEPFRPQKLRSSLMRSGADNKVANSIVEHIEGEIRDGDSTSAIYKHAFSLLKSEHKPVAAARYSMKRAIRELGPSGFPFEDFVAQIFKERGYTTKTGAILRGKCVEHELDMLAKKDGVTIGAEIKFHNNLGITSDLKVALYVDARFIDLQGAHIDEGWLITNTRFTKNALAYGKCRGLKMVSWSYPQKGNLQDLIEEAGVQPVTALPALSGREKELLLSEGIVLCKMLNEDPEQLKTIFSEKKRQELLEQSRALCSGATEV